MIRLDFIYEFVDTSGIPFYVGITDDLTNRYQSHMVPDGIGSQKDTKIQAILHDNNWPELRVIEVIINDRPYALLREKYWIQAYRAQGVPLTNVIYMTGPLEQEEIDPLQIEMVQRRLQDVPHFRLRNDWHGVV